MPVNAPTPKPRPHGAPSSARRRSADDRGRGSRGCIRTITGAIVLAVLLAAGTRPGIASAHLIATPGDPIAHIAEATTSPEGASGARSGISPGSTSANTQVVAAGSSLGDASASAGDAPEGSPEGTTPTTGWIPNDTGIPGQGDAPGDWRNVQWNFAGRFGVEAPQAWTNVSAEGAPGGASVIVAVLDTGVAYANRGQFRRSPDFSPYTFVKGYDFIDHTPYPNDHNGHGTFVAGTIAEATNNGYGLTGLAFAARIMPVRVLNSEGEGDASTIAEGVRYAVNHGARVINMSLEFSPDVTARDIPKLMAALRYAYRHNVVVVAAAGNEGRDGVDYPARAPHVIAVGATTEHGCLADYSNDGPELTLVAPGGGADADLPGDPNCRPSEPAGRDIFQMTFTGSSPRVFGFPGGYEGTSMATPHVAATVALIIAGRVLGPHPTVTQITARLQATARKLGDPGDAYLYGAGLLDAATATAAGPGAVG